MGYKGSHQIASSKIGKQNQVFIASKTSISLGDLKAPQRDEAAITNFLHVKLVGSDLEIVGIRAPAYNKFSERQDYWREFASIIGEAGNRRIIFLGDVNYDPFQGLAASVSEIRFDLASAYTIPNPKGNWSFISLDGKARTRIDHAFVSDSIKIVSAEYLSDYDGIKLAGNKDSGAVTDHAALVITLAL